MTVQADRRRRLSDRLRHAGLDGLLVTHPPNIRYLSGFTGSSGTLLVAPDGALLATDGRYDEQAARECPDVPRVLTRGDGWLRERTRKLRRLGLESDRISWDRARRLVGLLDHVAVEPASGNVEALRLRKDEHELRALRRACAVTAEAFTAACGWLRPGMSEREVARRLLADLEERGAHGPAFDPVVAGGPNGALPHHRPGDRRLQPGDLLVLDFGGLIDGYRADMTRTVALGAPVRELTTAYAAVAAAQEAGVAAVRAGVTAGAVDDACRSVLAAAGYGEMFLHPTGHGIGLEVHEEPILRAGAAATLASRMAVTVEPGAYLPGVGGIRIEDTVLVGPDGCDTLTPAPKDLVVL